MSGKNGIVGYIIISRDNTQTYLFREVGPTQDKYAVWLTGDAWGEPLFKLDRKPAQLRSRRSARTIRRS